MVNPMASTYTKEKACKRRIATPTNGKILEEVVFHKNKVIVPIHAGIKNIIFSPKIA
jgi:hypothetical protein